MNPTPKKSKTNSFGLYWTDYGGGRELLKSSYFRVAFIFSACSFPIWSGEGWWDVVISVVPSLTGFSLAAYAMLIAFGNERFLKVITTPVSVDESSHHEETRLRPSVYLTTGAAFVHFIIVQTIALLAALLCKAWCLPVWPWVRGLLKSVNVSEQTFICASRIFWGVGYFAFVYGVLCGLAATMRIYRMSRWYAKLMQTEESPDQRP